MSSLKARSSRKQRYIHPSIHSILHHPTNLQHPTGIGLGIADCCLANGAARIYSIDIGRTKEQFASLSSKYPNQLFALQTDITKEESIQTAIDAILKDAGALHGIV